MNIEQIREYCLGKPAATEGFPFGDATLVFKVGGKIFALLFLENSWLNLKCDPDKAIELRERFAAVVAPYHMHKKLWNTILPDSATPDRLIREWIDDSYDLVVAKLTRAQRRLVMSSGK
ncbi:MAG: MmcQ/YjbR family DNA-binding protein [Prevotellaceae bacterium]|jgi:predicted DNA-binding protein (MmcQ/YjbR family)|nr:MmcQ/YjbR family DNA-binding protein [Prevotellaceae bacterium]